VTSPRATAFRESSCVAEVDVRNSTGAQELPAPRSAQVIPVGGSAGLDISGNGLLSQAGITRSGHRMLDLKNDSD
jgi:hypothetical protein